MKDKILFELIDIILRDKLSSINLYNYEKYITSDEDLEYFKSFFDQINVKYSHELIRISENTGDLEKNNLLSEIYNVLVSLSPNEFEKLSAKICEYFGFDFEFYATKQSYDEGVDFFAFKKHNQIKVDNREYIFGQCKKFENTLVTVSEIRELVGAVALFKMQEYCTSKGSYQNHVINSYTPVSVYFVTSYHFSPPSIELCKNCGIIPINIVDIIYIIFSAITKNKFNWLNSSNNFDKTKFDQDIAKVQIAK